MLGQPELRDKLVTTLNGGVNGWNDDEPAVLEAACELMATRYFGPEPADHGGDVSDLAGMLAEATAEARVPVSQQQAASLIRAALDRTAPDAGLRPSQAYIFRSYLLSFMTMKLSLSEDEVDAVLREAERIAFDRGRHPNLVPRRNSGAAAT
jgi:hypothetical protein